MRLPLIAPAELTPEQKRLYHDTFGQHGTNEMIYLFGLYSMVSTTLNGFNVPVPERVNTAPMR
jgi:hypothetical protein